MRVAIIGAGMAGASLAYHLSAYASVDLIEAEAQAGYHTTGRSAALYAKAYGNEVIRKLTAACEDFYTKPDDGFAQNPLLSKRGALFVARADQDQALQGLCADIEASDCAAEILTAAQVKAMVPSLRDDYLSAGLIDHSSSDMDVDAILQGYLRGARKGGMIWHADARIEALETQGSGWRLRHGGGVIDADIVVNAAGAWADHVATLAGLGELGIIPKRRTAFLVDPPAGSQSGQWPAIIDVEETFYVKPEAGMLLCSPADETPSEAMDAFPEDLDIAEAVDRIQNVMDLPVNRIQRSWAGLRSFAADKTPVVGFDPRVSGFFWLAGQGGYGIQTAPAMAQLATHLITGQALNLELDGSAIAEAMKPDRLIQAA